MSNEIDEADSRCDKCGFYGALKVYKTHDCVNLEQIREEMTQLKQNLSNYMALYEMEKALCKSKQDKIVKLLKNSKQT